MTNNMKQALQAVLDLEPTLTPYGLILHKDSIREGRTIEGARENFGLKGFTLAYEYCRSIATIETINRKTTNYGLKHTVEHYYDYYIANGEFIAGAIAAGFKHHYYGPNACFNMSAKSLREKRFGKTGEPLRGDGRATLPNFDWDFYRITPGGWRCQNLTGPPQPGTGVTIGFEDDAERELKFAKIPHKS